VEAGNARGECRGRSAYGVLTVQRSEGLLALPGVEELPSAISVPGARALWQQENVPAGPQEAFMIGREFAHMMPDMREVSGGPAQFPSQIMMLRKQGIPLTHRAHERPPV
jgi:hypothetical protein